MAEWDENAACVGYSRDMTETQLGGNAASAITPGRLVLLRHGQTVWSESGQHTGRTNIPLTDIGCDQARAAGERLREAFPQGFAQGCMFASPLRRAQQTAQLAGYGDSGINLKQIFLQRTEALEK